MALGAGFTTIPAHAFETTLYGDVGLYVGSNQTSGTERQFVMKQGNMQTSYVGIKGEEELSNGITSIFVLESFLQPDDGIAGRNASDPFWSRNSYVALRSDKAGQLTLGRQTNPYYVTQIVVNPFGGSTVFSPLVLQTFVPTYGATVLGDTVWNKAVQYATPKLGGWQGSATYSIGDKTVNPTALPNAYSNGDFNNVGINAIYATPQSPLSIGLAAQRVREAISAPSTEQLAYLAGGAYDFKRVKLYAAAQGTHSTITDLDTKTYQLGAGIPVTPKGTIMASWADTKWKYPKATLDTKRDTAAVGYDYFLSKQTDVQAVYIYDKVSAKPSGSSYNFGIRRQF